MMLVRARKLSASRIEVCIQNCIQEAHEESELIDPDLIGN
jgi:hypothetical protein